MFGNKKKTPQEKLNALFGKNPSDTPTPNQPPNSSKAKGFVSSFGAIKVAWKPKEK